jgi:hypothetical protein
MSFQFNLLFPDATDDQKWEQIRSWRNAELAQSDWTQLTDSPVDKSAWATYRQVLRDLPASTSDLTKIQFPVKPS